MNATAIKPYTAETCKRIVAACESQLAMRKAVPEAWRFAEEMSFRAGVAEVMWSAVAAQDNLAGHEGFNDSHDQLHAALVDLDHYPIWEAAR
jgi:hypothetical protein